MERITGNTSLFEVSVNKYDDLLILNCADLSVFEKFTALYKNIENIAELAEQELAEMKKKYADEANEGINIGSVMDYVQVNITFSRRVMEELDNVFGQGFTDKVYRESYENNPDFVPDNIALVELIESLIPIMEKAYGERIKRNKSKYSADKRGKHTKSKEELIAEYREKNSAHE